MCQRDDLLHRRHRPQRIRHLRDRHQLRPAAEQLAVFVQQDLPTVVHRNHADARAHLRGKLLPRHDVGVVLQVRDDDLVPGADVLAAERLRNEVDRLRGAAHEDDLA